MNIAITSLYLPSTSKMGVGYQVHYLANGLVRRGHGVTVFSICPRPVDAFYQVEQLDVQPPMRSMKVSWRLRRIDWSPFDVLHAHGDDWFLWNRQVPPHVRTVHGSCLSEAMHIPSLKGKIYMLWLAMLETVSCAVADRVVGVSANTCASYPWIQRVIPNGVDLSAFKPGEKEPKPTILFVGTYANRKRGKLLMEVFAREVLPRVREAKLWMVCSDAPAAEGVEVLGRLTTEQLADRYRRAWVFCLPSSYEGFGVPYIEAMASGTPVVATPNPGAREVLDGGRVGVLVTIAKLGETLFRMLSNTAERQHLSDAGLTHAQQFSLSAMVTNYERIYHELVGREYCYTLEENHYPCQAQYL